MPPNVTRPCAFVFLRAGDRVLVSEMHEPVEGIFYRPPGGGIEFRETSEQAARRELHEELGVTLEELVLLGVREEIFRLGVSRTTRSTSSTRDGSIPTPSWRWTALGSSRTMMTSRSRAWSRCTTCARMLRAAVPCRRPRPARLMRYAAPVPGSAAPTRQLTLPSGSLPVAHQLVRLGDLLVRVGVAERRTILSLAHEVVERRTPARRSTGGSPGSASAGTRGSARRSSCRSRSCLRRSRSCRRDRTRSSTSGSCPGPGVRTRSAG